MNKESILSQHIHRLVVTALQLLANAAAGVRPGFVNEFGSSDHHLFDLSDVADLLFIILFFNFVYRLGRVEANVDRYIGVAWQLFGSGMKQRVQASSFLCLLCLFSATLDYRIH